jgi:hypothetical protein
MKVDHEIEALHAKAPREADIARKPPGAARPLGYDDFVEM